MSIRSKVNTILLVIIIMMSSIPLSVYYALTRDIRTYDQILANVLAANKLPGFVQQFDQDIETYKDHPSQELRSRIETNLRIASELVQTIQHATAPGHTDSMRTIEGMTKMIDSITKDAIAAMHLIDRKEVNETLLDSVELLDSAVELSRENMDTFLAQELEHTVHLRKEIIIKNECLQIALFGGILAFSLVALWVGKLFANKWILRPVETLTAAATQISTGDLNIVLTGTDRTDELGVLSRAFESMAGQLKGLITGLEQRVAERTAQLTVAKEQAEAANRAKSVFLASMSHELRTPLNAVLGFSQLMKNDPDVSAKQKESLGIITRSGEHLLNLINNVLDISKIESGRVELEASHLDLFQLIEEMKSLMGMRAHEKALDFTLEQSRNLPRNISVDGGKLRQVLINLIGNAIKYTTSGGVILRAMAVEVEKERSGQVRVRFEVADTGPGIREQDRERIFSPFVQLEDRPTTEAGTGLGLAISKQYVELMGGRIGVAGGPGKGSIFHFEIPVAVLPSEATPAEPRRGRVIGLAEGQPRYRLLIAEDHPQNRMLIYKLLKPLGFDLREAANGQEAVAIFEAWHPHLIWMDIRMPVMDGLEATRHIKATDAGAQTRIVAVTAHALEEERREILSAGCDDFIRKPYQYVDILDALARNLGVRFVYEEETPPADGVLPLNTAELVDLPGELLNELEQTLVLLDISAVNRAIEAIRTHHPSQADALGAVARDLQFGRMLRMIRTATGVTGPEDVTCKKK